MAGESVEAGQALWTSKDLILLLGTGFVAGISGYIGAYLKKDAEIKALSKNIAEIQRQQVLLTKATEGVRKDIEHQVWKKQEMYTTRQQKLEEYVRLAYKLRFTVYGDTFEEIMENGFIEVSNEMHLLNELYFPELRKEHAKIIEMCLGSLEAIHSNDKGSEKHKRLESDFNKAIFNLAKNGAKINLETKNRSRD
ncbi:hypothetical protein L4D09_24685 [Photobacterium makurazakiensis]|uniref:hypothetical protein n=1 Tax=Photobacterium makurazakiensis TaxID=2910234 RepID=UPI003D0FB1DF